MPNFSFCCCRFIAAIINHSLLPRVIEAAVFEPASPDF